MTTAWGRKIFYECVACVCLKGGTIFLVTAFFMALGFLVGVGLYHLNYQLIYTNLFGIQKVGGLQSFYFKRY